MKKALTTWFVFCTWLAPITEHAQASDLKQALFSTIVLSYSVDSLKDGIAFTKSPKRQDLRHLWHGAKYAHVVTAIAVGALNVLSIQKYGWKKTLLIDAVGFIVGVLIWKYSYPAWRKVDWPDWA